MAHLNPPPLPAQRRDSTTVGGGPAGFARHAARRPAGAAIGVPGAHAALPPWPWVTMVVTVAMTLCVLLLVLN